MDKDGIIMSKYMKWIDLKVPQGEFIPIIAQEVDSSTWEVFKIINKNLVG